MNNWCCICGDDTEEIREGSPVCDYHRALIDNGTYTLDELREMRDERLEDEDDE